MSEQINEAKANQVNEANEQKPADVDGTKMHAQVVNGKVVYTDGTPKTGGLWTAIKKGAIKLGMAIKRHPVMTTLIVGGAVAGGVGAKKAYEYGHDHGYADGYTAKTQEVEAAEQAKLEAEALAKLEAEQCEVPEVEAMVNENGEEVG